MSFEPVTAPTGERFAFVHVPKTGGLTVCKLLDLRPQHHAFQRLQDREGVFTFAFVRDPWERLLSAYYYLLRGGRHNDGDLNDRKLLVPFRLNFSAFVQAFADDPEKFFAAQHLRPQAPWVTKADGTVGVEFLGRFEHYARDLKTVCDRLGYPYLGGVRENATNHPTIREAYTRETSKLVRRIYARDCDLFGYSRPMGLLSVPLPAKADGTKKPMVEANLLRHPHQTKDPAIVTASDEPFAPGALYLVTSIRRLDKTTPVIVIDLGLSIDSRRKLTEAGAMLAARPPCPCDPYLDFALPKQKCWFQKPWYFDAAGPHRRVLWLDSDTVVLKDLDKLLAKLATGPVLTLNHGAAGLNKPELYNMLPVPEQVQTKGCNAGVLGFDLDRDAELMASWRDMTIRTLIDQDIQPLVTAGDQGALLWCLHAHGIAHTIDEDPKWNYPGHHLTNHKDRPARRMELLEQGEDFIDAVAEDHPEAAVAHFVAYPKPWQVPSLETTTANVPTPAA